MSPLIRLAVVVIALTGACLIARAAWPFVAGNLTAMKSWTRTDGEVRGMNGDIEFEIGQEPDAYRAFAPVDHTWDLSLFKRAKLFVDPADRTRIKTAGFFQMWLAPAELSGILLLLLATAWMGSRLGSEQAGAPTLGPAESRWMFTASPGPMGSDIVLHSPSKQVTSILCWSLLGVAMAVIPMFVKGGNPVSRIGYMTLGSAFALSLWGFAWHTKTLEISASDRGVRMTSILGWREVPWGLVRSVEDQDIFTTYYNGRMRMWELPFPGSTVRVLAINGESDHTLMSFSPDLVPQDSMKRLFELCTARTGLKLHGRTIAIRY